ncbi:MAG TPA: carbohydrate ABC transporter permease [Acidimicrobiales bacterium]|nr:carbohydrate ABC transporter permease [Acidimicrobiales bacterium]
MAVTVAQAQPRTGTGVTRRTGSSPPGTAVGERTGQLPGRVAATLKATVLMLFAIYFLGPVYCLVIAATKPTDSIYTSGALLPYRPQLWTNLGYIVTYDGGLYFRWLLNSATYAIGGAAVSTLIAGAAGYYLAMFRFKWREGVFLTVIGGMLVPATALALPLFLLFARLNIVGSYWSVMLPSIVSPFALFLCRVAAEASVPGDLVEAGRIDGASEARIFFSIAVRLMFPGLVTAFLAQFVGIWNNYLLPLVMLTNKDMYPITVGLGTWQGQTTHTDILETLILVGALISVVPLVIAFVFLQRFWRSGLALGGVKA